MDPQKEPQAPKQDEEATMKAIADLESESNPTTDENNEASTPQSSSEETAPVVEPQPTTESEPLTPDASLTKTPEVTPAQEPSSDTTPTPLPTETPETTAQDTQNNFQPFPGEKPKSNKVFIIVLLVILAVGLGVGGYFGWQYLQSQQPTPSESPQTTDTLEEDTPTDTVPTESDVVTEFETSLDDLDDGEFDDSTLSDETLLAE